MKHITLLFIILFVVSGCVSDGPFPVESKSSQFDIVNTFTIQLPFGTPVINNSLKSATINGQEFLFKLNKRDNCILQIEPKEGGKVTRYCFDVEGPEGVGQIEGVSQGTETELVFASRKPVHYFFNPVSKETRKVELKSEEGIAFTPGMFTSKFYEEYVTIGDTGYFLQSGYLQVTDLGRQYPDYKMIAGTHNKTAETNYTSFTFPADYHAKKQLMGISSLAGDDEKLVVSIFMDNRLHVYNPADGSDSNTLVKSKYFPDDFPEIVNNDGQDRLEYFARHPFYSSILYDPYREVYYRIAKMPAGDDLTHILERKNIYFYNPHQFSVMVLDKSLKLLDEFLLPADTYVMKNMVVTKDGLAISKMHPLNSEAKVEDQLVLDVFQFSIGGEPSASVSKLR
jgi:hypothetical protein